MKRSHKRIMSIKKDQGRRSKKQLEYHLELNTELKRQQSRFIPVYRDVLTQLQNRYAFYETLWQLGAKAARFAVLHIDIDKFSVANERLGTQKCDGILQQIAYRLNKLVADEQHLARYGNDEFTVIVSNVQDLQEKSKKILNAIRKPFQIDGEVCHLTASIGACIYPDQVVTVDLLMKAASSALNRCKLAGGDHVVQYDLRKDMSDQVQLQLDEDLYSALEKKQFFLYYQPIYTVDRCHIVGVEALIRWQHPTWGLLFPDTFLPFCEETSLIIPIGKWVLKTACQQLKLWHAAGIPDLIMAVNISGRQLNHPKFMDDIQAILATTQLPPQFLEIELTESLLMQNTEQVLGIFQSMRQIGIQISLDDFGTGYSSLSYLRQFPLTRLKIDRSFISEIAQSTTGEAIVDIILSLTKVLGLTCIAEGVETEEQLALLQQKHCDFIQGFLLSKPLPALEVEQLLKETLSMQLKQNLLG